LGKDDSGYWVHRNATGFRGENPRHALVAEFTRQGAEVRSEIRGHNLRWRLETRAYGYGDALHPLKAVAPNANANRVEYRRGGVAEWYENGPLGLEQGFTLAHRPGKANGQPLTVALALSGDLAAAPAPGGKSLELRGKDGQAALRYTGLKAKDATGRELRSWLEIRGERLLVRVDDGGARYPVTVDPWIQQAELTASDGAAEDNFGNSVAVSGTTAVVGAWNHTVGSNTGQGVAYVFVETGGTWSQQAELTEPYAAAYNNFGSSVAVSGSTAVVGAPCYPRVFSNCYPTSDSGAAYVFVQSDGTWSQQAELTASDSAAYDWFGSSVAVDGSTAVVGAPGKNDAQGAAYVFVESGGTWSQQAELTASDGEGEDRFGWSVAVSGSTAVVGAIYHPGWASPGPGAAYVFVESGGTWSQQAELTASDGAAYDWFGGSVAVSGSTAVVGANQHTVGSNGQQGTAYVFVKSGGTWTQQQELTASDGVAGDQFGASAIDGSMIVVGASQHTFGSNGQQGAAYVFVESGGTWSQQQELIASDGAAGDAFGNAVAISGSTGAVGALNHTVGSNTKQGAAYVFGSSGPLYTLSASPSSLTVLQGGQATSTITITPSNGFSGNVSLSASGLPNGVTASFNPNPATNTCTLTLTASPTATMGTTTVPVIGTSGSLAQTTPLTLTVPTTVVLSSTSLSFGNVVVNSTSVAKTVTLRNSGTLTLDINSIDVTPGTNFQISSNTCGSNLAAAKICKVSVEFEPTGQSAFKASLVFADNGANSPQTVALSGKGVEPATLAPTSATYATRAMGTTSAAKTFTLTNNQTVELTSIAISTTGDFAVSATTCTTTLAAKGKCTISVTFTPTETGKRTGQLSVSDSASNSPQPVTLSGTGVVPATLTPASATYAAQKVGTTSAAKTFTLTNDQTVVLNNVVISTNGPYAVSATTCTTSLAAKGKCTISVTFTPTETGTRTGQLIVNDSASNSPQASNLKGTGK
jgi:hypothetical protein